MLDLKNKDTTSKKGDCSTSGFTENLEEQTVNGDSMPIECTYGNLHERYVSATGHTRLFSATKYGKRYILKCLKNDFLYTPVYQQALTKEFEIGLQLEHPNICRTFGLEQLPDLGATIVMEHIDGCTLKSLIEKNELTPELAGKITRQLMDALEYMHSKQIVHRDLKPSNIMVTHTGQNVKVIDFGLSDSDAFYILKLPAGTTGYIAPEQFLEGAKAEPRTDIYSLGMVIADMAKATGDKKLEKIATSCTCHAPHLRPYSIEDLKNMASNTHPHSPLATLLVFLVIALAVSVGVSYLLRYQDASKKGPRQDQKTVTDDTMPKDNQVMDYHLWDQ